MPPAFNSARPIAPVRMRPRFEIVRRPTPSTVAALWQLYRASFEPLAEAAVLPQFLSRGAFTALVEDPGFVKVVGWRADRPVALGVLGNDLDAVPQVSAAFLRRRYPDHARDATLFCGVFVCVDPEERGGSLFARLVTAMGRIVAQRGGVVVFDVCEFNETHHRVGEALEAIAGWFPRSNFVQIDTQRYYAVELPETTDRFGDDLDVTAAPPLRALREVIDLRDEDEVPHGE